MKNNQIASIVQVQTVDKFALSLCGNLTDTSAVIWKPRNYVPGRLKIFSCLILDYILPGNRKKHKVQSTNSNTSIQTPIFYLKIKQQMVTFYMKLFVCGKNMAL